MRRFRCSAISFFYRMTGSTPNTSQATATGQLSLTLGGRYQTIALCGLVVLVVTLVFGQVLGFAFVNWDDGDGVYNNPRVTRGLSVGAMVGVFIQRHVESWAPLTTVSHMLVWQLFGNRAWGHHLVNVLLHTASTVLLFLVFRQMTCRAWPAALVAALFAIHPLHVESVAWVTERKDTLSGLFFMLALGAYVGYVHAGSKRWYMAILVLFALGLVAKPVVITLPFVLLLLDYWPLRRLGAKAFYEKIPLFVLVGLSCCLTIWGQRNALAPNEWISWSWRIQNALISYAAYVGQFFYPANLTVLYSRRNLHLPPGQVLGGLAVLVSITTIALLLRRKAPYLLVGWLWYVGMLVPMIGLIQFGAQSEADRFAYLPHIGLYLALAWGVADLGRLRPPVRVACGVGGVLAVAVLTACAWQQTTVWQDSRSLWTNAMTRTPRNDVAYNKLGHDLAHHDRPAEAITWFQAALRVRPTADVHNSLGNCLKQLGRLEEAIAEFRQAVALKPEHAEAHWNLGLALAATKHPDQAVEQYYIVVRLRPDFAEVHNNLGNVLAAKGDSEAAIAEYQKALAITPLFAAAHNNLGNIFAGQSRPDKAIAEYQAALVIKPDFAEARKSLELVQAAQARLNSAVAHYEKMLDAHPDNADIHYNLGSILVSGGRPGKALMEYRSALQLKADDQATLNDLAWLLATCPQAELRNGAEAIELARRAERVSGGKDPDVLDTLAAAYAEAGKFSEAVAAAGKALRLAEQHGRPAAALTPLRERMALYKAKEPFRQIAPLPVTFQASTDNLPPIPR
jgi:protein O-mannosyl-transferase